MPSYEYTCPKCSWKGTRYQISIAARDEQVCDQAIQKRMFLLFGAEPGTESTHPCGAKLERKEIPEAADMIIETKSGYQSAAIMKDGSTVTGTFGGTRHAIKKGFNQRSKT